MATIVAAVATMADLERHPGRCELIAGEVIETAPAGFEHGLVVANIAAILRAFVLPRHLGRVLAGDPGFILGDGEVRAPDVAFLDQERVAQVPARGFMRCVPNLAVEVVSPNDTHSAVIEKVRMWMRSGVGLVWVVDPPSQTIAVYALGKAVASLDVASSIDGGEVLPGFACAVAEIFA